MAATQINSQKIKDGTVDSGDLANSAVTNAKLAPNAVTADKVLIHASAKGSTLVANGSGNTDVLPPGTDGQVLSADSTGFVGMGWVRRGKVLFTSGVTSSNITNTTTETEFDQKFTLPAGYLQAGTLIKLRFWGRYTQSSGTVTLRVYFGTSNWLDFGAFTPTTTATSRGWVCDVTLLCLTTGSSGTIRGGATLTFNNLAAPVVTSNADFTVNTTIARDLKMTGQWSVAATGNVVQTTLTEMTEF